MEVETDSVNDAKQAWLDAHDKVMLAQRALDEAILAQNMAYATYIEYISPRVAHIMRRAIEIQKEQNEATTVVSNGA